MRVGKSKTEAGTGRVIPLNDKATKVLRFWADQFPDRKPEHFTFPSERYGAGGDDFEPTVFDVDPETAIGSWKEAWESVKQKTGVVVRFHDLRHTCVTQDARGRRPACRSWPRSSAGARRRRRGWPSATGILGTWRCGRRWRFLARLRGLADGRDAGNMPRQLSALK